jgi:hypothetical protein
MVNGSRRALDVAAGLAAAGVVALALEFEATRPAPLATALFVLLLFAAECAQIRLPSATTVSPGFMMIMATIAALDGGGVVLGAAIVGFCGTAQLTLLRSRRYATQFFNSCQYLLSGACAAVVFQQLDWRSGPGLFASAILATAGFAVVNVALVLPHVALGENLAPSAVWADMRPAVPNYLAFGLLGLLLGQLYSGVGWISLPLLIVPVAIARKVFASSLELKEAHESTIRVFIRAIEAKDTYTAGHAERVARYALYMGREMNFSPARLEHLRYAALMHDIGKLAVPGRLLNKPGKLTPEEYRRVQRHNRVCIDILTRVDFMKTMVVAASDTHAHFENSDADADSLVMEAHIVAVADAFDAMTSTRSYRRALTQEVAFAELQDKAGSQFNPECVNALVRAIERRGEHYGLGYEEDAEQFAVAPPVVGVGSAGLGDLLTSEAVQA